MIGQEKRKLSKSNCCEGGGLMLPIILQRLIIEYFWKQKWYGEALSMKERITVALVSKEWFEQSVLHFNSLQVSRQFNPYTDNLRKFSKHISRRWCLMSNINVFTLTHVLDDDRPPRKKGWRALLPGGKPNDTSIVHFHKTIMAITDHLVKGDNRCTENDVAIIEQFVDPLLTIDIKQNLVVKFSVVELNGVIKDIMQVILTALKRNGVKGVRTLKCSLTIAEGGSTVIQWMDHIDASLLTVIDVAPVNSLASLLQRAPNVRMMVIRAARGSQIATELIHDIITSLTPNVSSLIVDATHGSFPLPYETMAIRFTHLSLIALYDTAERLKEGFINYLYANASITDLHHPILIDSALPDLLRRAMESSKHIKSWQLQIPFHPRHLVLPLHTGVQHLRLELYIMPSNMSSYLHLRFLEVFVRRNTSNEVALDKVLLELSKYLTVNTGLRRLSLESVLGSIPCTSPHIGMFLDVVANSQLDIFRWTIPTGTDVDSLIDTLFKSHHHRFVHSYHHTKPSPNTLLLTQRLGGLRQLPLTTSLTNFINSLDPNGNSSSGSSNGGGSGNANATSSRSNSNSSSNNIFNSFTNN